MRKTVLILVFSLVLGTGVAYAQNGDMGIQSEVPSEDIPEFVDDLPDPGLLPGNPLYFVKNIGEGISGLFSFGTVKKIRREIQMAERRLAEARVLAEKERYDLAESTINRYKKTMEDIQKRFERANEDKENIDEVAKNLAESTLKHQSVLAEVYQRVPDEAKAGVLRAMEVSRQGHEMAISAVSEERQGDLQEALSPKKQSLDKKLEKLRSQGIPIPEIPVPEIGPQGASTGPTTSTEPEVNPPGPPPEVPDQS